MKELIAFSIPTGIGAKIGGYAGDCGHIARKFSEYFRLIVNPNVVNAGVLSALNDEMLYVEGYAFDALLAGETKLKTVRQNKIGVIFDCSIPKNILNIHINTINAAKLVWGLDITGYEVTKEPVGVGFETKEGISTGSLNNPETLLSAANKLIEKGAQAIAVVCFFEDHDDTEYSCGEGIDPIGGVEAVISHYLTKELNIPAAHSPAFGSLDISEDIVDKKASAEYISSTYLPCVLQGLNKAPQLSDSGKISCTHIKALVVPSGALGSKAVLGCLKNNALVCAVKNPSQLNVTCQKLKQNGIIEFDDYDSCLNFLRKKFYG